VIRSGVMLASDRFSGIGIFLGGELIANIGVAGVFNAESEAVEDEEKLMLELSWFSLSVVLEDWTMVFSPELDEGSGIVREAELECDASSVGGFLLTSTGGRRVLVEKESDEE